MMIFDDDHLKGEARQGAGEVIQAGAGQVRFDKYPPFFLTTKSISILFRCWRAVSDPLIKVKV